MGEATQPQQRRASSGHPLTRASPGRSPAGCQSPAPPRAAPRGCGPAPTPAHHPQSAAPAGAPPAACCRRNGPCAAGQGLDILAFTPALCVQAIGWHARRGRQDAEHAVGKHRPHHPLVSVRRQHCLQPRSLPLAVVQHLLGVGGVHSCGVAMAVYHPAQWAGGRPGRVGAGRRPLPAASALWRLGESDPAVWAALQCDSQVGIVVRVARNGQHAHGDQRVNLGWLPGHPLIKHKWPSAAARAHLP